MKSRLKVVLDTNVLLVSISSRSGYHWIFEKLIANEYDLCITNEILTEYEEVISNKFSPVIGRDIIKALLLLPNVYKTEVYYKWNLIKDDIDDNKFVDCTINSNSHLLITHDKHFNILKKINFPKIKVADIHEFEIEIRKLQAV